MKFRSVIRIAAAVLAVGLSTTGILAQECKPLHTFQTLEPGVLTVSMHNYAPFSVREDDGSITGIDPAILKGFAEKECLELKFEVVDWSVAVQMVGSGKSDVAIGSFYRTKKRSEVLGLSAPIYLDKMGLISKEGYSSLKDLKGKKIGSVDGYSWNPPLKEIFGDSLVLYKDSVGMSQDVANGRIDAGTDSYSYAVTTQKSGGYPGLKVALAEPDPNYTGIGQMSLKGGQCGIPYPKDNVALGEALDAHIAELMSSGQMASILVEHGLDASLADVGEPILE